MILNRVIATVMTTLVMLGTLGNVDVTAEQISEERINVADDNVNTSQFEDKISKALVNKVEPIKIDLSNFDNITENKKLKVKSSIKLASTNTVTEIDKYSTKYYYNLLSDDEKALWDAIDTMCMNYITTKSDINNYYGDYMTELVFSNTLSEEETFKVATLFEVSNPQYYFIEPIMYYAEVENQGTDTIEYGIAFKVYNAFINGEKRYKATQTFFKKVESWISKVTETTDYDRCIEIHDMIIDNVEYNDDIIGSDGYVNLDQEETYFSQSAYSVFECGETVCNGFSKAYEMMCNAFGIDTIVVSSENHSWNKIRLNDSWYNADLTFDNADDETSERCYLFFARSDKAYLELSESDTRKVEDIYKSYLPKCTLDTDSDWSFIGKLPKNKE